MDNKLLFCYMCKVRLCDQKSLESHSNGKRHQLALHNAYILSTKEKCSVFITGLPNLVPKEKVLSYLNDFGTVKDVHIGDGNKFAIVEFGTEDEAQKLLTMGQVHFMGKTLHIKPRKMKDKTETADFVRFDEDFDSINEQLNHEMDFDMQLRTLIDCLQPDQGTLIRKYELLCRDLDQTLQASFPGCRIYPFGSTVTGLNFKHSDIDVYVEVRTQIKGNGQESVAAQHARKARNALPRYGLFTNVVAILKAKTPIVKCVHVLTSISCDFNFKNMLGVCNTFLIRYYLGIDVKIKLALLILKYWSKVHDLTGNNGKFSNYAIAMMFIFYLQQKPFNLPPIIEMQSSPECVNMQDGWNGGFKPIVNIGPVFKDKSVQEILHGFFSFCLNFDYNLNIICPYLGKIMLKMDFLKPSTLPDYFSHYKKNIGNGEGLRVEAPICIQDPFEHNHNLAKAISSKVADEFVSLCKIAVNTLQSNDTIRNTVLYQLFTEEPEDIEFRYSERNCQFKLQMGNVLAYLEEKVPLDVEDKPSEIRKIWYETVNQFIVTILIKVLKLEVMVKKEEVASKSQRIDDQSDVKDTSIVDSVRFHCIGRLNVWDARRVISKDIDQSNQQTILDKQIYITNYISDVLYGKILVKDPIVEFYLTLNAKQKPIQVDFILTMLNASKGSFKSLAVFFISKLPHWFNVYEKELNDNVKKTLNKDKKANDDTKTG